MSVAPAETKTPPPFFGFEASLSSALFPVITVPLSRMTFALPARQRPPPPVVVASPFFKVMFLSVTFAVVFTTRTLLTPPPSRISVPVSFLPEIVIVFTGMSAGITAFSIIVPETMR